MTAKKAVIFISSRFSCHTLSLMDFNRQAVGIMEEGHLFPGKGIGSHRLTNPYIFYIYVEKTLFLLSAKLHKHFQTLWVLQQNRK